MTLRIVSDATGGRIQNETPIDVMVVGAAGAVTFSTAVTANSDLTVNGKMKVAAAKMPVFSAYLNANQTLTTNTYTTVVLNAELLDNANAFNTTNGRFQPAVAGWYQVSATLTITTTSGSASNAQLSLYKNGSSYKRLAYRDDTSAAINSIGLTGSTLVYMNGTTDYLEMAAFCGAAGRAEGGANVTHLSGFLVYPD